MKSIDDLMIVNDNILVNTDNIINNKINIFGLGINFTKDNKGIIHNIRVDLDDFANELQTRGEYMTLQQLNSLMNKINNQYKHVDENMHNNVDMRILTNNQLFDTNPGIYNFDDIKHLKVDSETKRKLKEAIISYQKDMLKKYIEDRMLSEGYYNENIVKDIKGKLVDLSRPEHQDKDDVEDEEDVPYGLKHIAQERNITKYDILKEEGDKIPDDDTIKYMRDDMKMLYIDYFKEHIDDLIDKFKEEKTQDGKYKYSSWNNYLSTASGKKILLYIKKLNLLDDTNNYSISKYNNREDVELEIIDKKPVYTMSKARHEILYEEQEMKRQTVDEIDEKIKDVIDNDTEYKNMYKEIKKNSELNIFTDFLSKDVDNIPTELRRENCNNNLFEKRMITKEKIENTIKQIDPELWKEIQKLNKKYDVKYDSHLTSDKKDTGGLGDAWAPIDGMIKIFYTDSKGNDIIIENINIEFKYYSNYDVKSKGNLSFELMYNTITTDYAIYQKELIIEIAELEDSITGINKKIDGINKGIIDINEKMDGINDKIDRYEILGQDNKKIKKEIDKLNKQKDELNKEKEKYERELIVQSDIRKRLNINNRDTILNDFYAKHYTAQVPMKFSKTGVKKNYFKGGIDAFNTLEDYTYLNHFLKPGQKRLLFEDGKIKDIKRMNDVPIIDKKTNKPKYDTIRGKYYMVIAFKDAIIGLNYSDLIRKSKIDPEDPLKTNKLVKTAYANKVSDHIGLKLWDFKPIYMDKTVYNKYKNLKKT